MRVILAFLLATVCLGPRTLRAQSVWTIAGTGTAGFSGDGARPDSAAFNAPGGIHGDATRQLWVADTGNHRVRRITAAFDTVVTFAGTGTAGYGGDGGAATGATLNSPGDVFVDSAGVVYVADTGNHAVRRITTAGLISTIAGTGAPGDSGDGGTATAAKLNSPSGVWASNSGVVYIADTGNHRVRRVSASGTITTVAGTGSAGFSGDGGAAAAAQLNAPADVFVDTAGVVYIADTGNHRIRAVATDSTITTVAGTGAAGFSGDGGAATAARLAFPRALFVDTAGAVYIADRFNHRIRRVNPGGDITTLAGDGTPGFAGDGAAANRARLSSPGGVWLHDGRELLVADTGNHRIRWIDDDALTGLRDTTAVGRGGEVRIFTAAFTGDGITAVKGVRLSLSDLSTATGLTTGDFTAFHLYESPDSLWSATDTLLTTIDADAVTLGSAFLLSAVPSPVPGADQRRFYLVTAETAADAVEGHAFKVDAAVGALSTSIGGHGVIVRAADSDQVRIDVVATRLIFATQPEGVISGNAFLRQPVVHAVDAAGFVDGDFSDTVTLAVSGGSGTLLQGTATATAGVATFSGVTYVATTDQEGFALVADDQAGGAEGDLPSVTSSALVANTVNDSPVVVALSFTIEEDDSVSVPLAAMVTDVDDSLSTLSLTFTARHTSARLDGTQLTITPEADFFGVDTLTITAEDPFGGRASDTSVLTVRAVNDRPVVQPLGRRILDEDDTLEVDLAALGEDPETPDDQLRWTFVPSPGLAVAYERDAARLRAWIPPDSAGTFSLRLSAADREGVTGTTLDTIEWRAVDDPPRLSLAHDGDLAVGDTLSIRLAPLTTDADDPLTVLTWSVSDTVGLQATVVGDSLSLTPSPGFAGTAVAVITAVDPAGGVGVDSVRLEVPAPEPRPPVLGALPAVTVTLGDTLRLRLSPWVADADDDVDALSWTVTAPVADSARLDLDTLVYVPAGASPYTAALAVTVRDPAGQSASATLQVQVEAPAPLLLPGLPDTLSIGVGGDELLLDDFVREPADRDRIVWSANTTGDLGVGIDPETRLLRFTPVGGSRAGGQVELTATTTRRRATDTIVVVITNARPRLDLPDLFLDAGDSVQLVLDDFALDDGSVSDLAWEAEPLAAGVTVSLNPAVRAVTLRADDTAVGPVPVRFTAADPQGGAGADTLVVTVRALAGRPDTTGRDTVETTTTNQAPVVGPLRRLRLRSGEGVTVALDSAASDDDDPALLRWVATADPGLEVTIDTERTLVVRAAADFAGFSAVRLTATDAFGARGSASLVIEVVAVTATPAPGDFDRDGRVGLVDFYLFVDQLGRTVFSVDWDPAYDLNGDGRVGIDDYFRFQEIVEGGLP